MIVRTGKKKKDSDKKIPIGQYIFILMLVIAIGLGTKTLANNKYRNYEEIYSFLEQGQVILVDSATVVNSEGSVEFIDGEIYIPVDAVKKYIDEHIFWDGDEDKLIITTADHVIRMQSDKLNYYVNNEELKLNLPIYTINEEAYLPKSVLEELYDIKLSYYEENNIVSIDHTDVEMKSAKIDSNVKLYYEPTSESYIAGKLKKGSSVYVFDINNQYSRVRSDEGLSGWVLTSSLNNLALITAVEKPLKDNKLWQVETGKINMYFEQVFNVNANYDDTRKANIDGVDVVSPTWFSFLNTDGDIKNIADKSYVTWAHNNKYQVWGLITDNFDAKISHAVLSSSETREHVIKQILAYMALYDLDGINIDFENVPKSDGEYFVQFIRELTPMVHEQGGIVSVDTYVPKSWTKHYNRKAVCEIADYIVVMGYDEHHASATESGSVASISWSREAITATINEGVDKDKIILGIPFYTRIWTEKNNTVTCKSYGMEGAYSVMKEKGAKITWLEDKGQNYAEVVEGDTTYKCWFEDISSLKLRLELVKEYDIAGIAAWKRGLETKDAWSVLKYELKTKDN